MHPLLILLYNYNLAANNFTTRDTEHTEDAQRLFGRAIFCKLQIVILAGYWQQRRQPHRPLVVRLRLWPPVVRARVHVDQVGLHACTSRHQRTRQLATEDAWSVVCTSGQAFAFIGIKSAFWSVKHYKPKWSCKRRDRADLGVTLNQANLAEI